MATLTTKKYYDYTSTSNTPLTMKAVFEQVRSYMASVLYTQDSLTSGIARFVIADMTEVGWSQKAASQFNTANLKYPFTAYNMGEPSLAREFRSYFQVSGKMYNSNIGKRMISIPMRMTFPMITFYSNPDDYRIGYKLLEHDATRLTRTFTTVALNGYSGLIPMTLTFEIAKGAYASEFQEQLRIGDIWDIQHNVTAYFQEILLDGSGENEVEEMLANIKRWAGGDPGDSTIQETLTNTSDPVISSSDPANDETDVPVGNSILLNFNVTMDETSVENAITLVPYFDNHVTWNIDSNVMLIDPDAELTSGTLYQIKINDKAKAFYNDSCLDSGVIKFTTEI